MATHRAPKQWSLTKNENVNSFKNWKKKPNIHTILRCELLTLSCRKCEMGEKTKAAPNRDFVDDGEEVQAAARRTKTRQIIRYRGIPYR